MSTLRIRPSRATELTVEEVQAIYNSKLSLRQIYIDFNVSERIALLIRHTGTPFEPAMAKQRELRGFPVARVEVDGRWENSKYKPKPPPPPKPVVEEKPFMHIDQARQLVEVLKARGEQINKVDFSKEPLPKHLYQDPLPGLQRS